MAPSAPRDLEGVHVVITGVLVLEEDEHMTRYITQEKLEEVINSKKGVVKQQVRVEGMVVPPHQAPLSALSPPGC